MCSAASGLRNKNLKSSSKNEDKHEINTDTFSTLGRGKKSINIRRITLTA